MNDVIGKYSYFMEDDYESAQQQSKHGRRKKNVRSLLVVSFFPMTSEAKVGETGEGWLIGRRRLKIESEKCWKMGKIDYELEEGEKRRKSKNFE